MNYANTQGDEELRKVIKLTLLQKKMDISIKNIQIINGAQQGLDLIMKSIISKTKNKIIVGSPTYHGALNIFKNNCKIFTVTMENDGFNMLELEELLQKEKISFIYTMMDFNCPTGISWSNEKKKQLIHLAQKYKTYILEDDFASDLYYKEKRRIFLKNLDKDTLYQIKSALHSHGLTVPTCKNIMALVEQGSVDLERIKLVLITAQLKKWDDGAVYQALRDNWEIKAEISPAAPENMEAKIKWLKYFSGIYSDKELRSEIEKIIINIPLETLNKNKSKLSKMTVFEFKSHLSSLKGA